MWRAMSELVLWSGALIAALAYGRLTLGHPSGLAVAVLKTVPVATFALIAFRAGAPSLLVLALVLSALGDFLLVFARPPGDKRPGADKGFLGGLGAFLASHVAYVGLFATTGDASRFAQPLVILAVLAMAVFAFVMGRLLLARAGELRLPVALYVSAILAMGITALMSGRPLAVAGAVCFMASDALLGTEKFLLDDVSRARWHRLIALALWTLYVAAQALILLAYP